MIYDLVYQNVDNRPKWDQIWIDFAFSIAQRSPDSKHQVGSVIVTKDNTSIWFGYNADEINGKNKRDSMEHGQSGFIHAEQNALLHLDYSDQRIKKLYTTLSPCIVCSRMIINSQTIKEVIYSELYYPEQRSLELLEKHEIIVRQFEYIPESVKQKIEQRKKEYEEQLRKEKSIAK